LYNDDGSVKGVATGNLGIGKDGEPTENFQLGMELHAKYTLFCEGARGQAFTHQAVPQGGADATYRDHHQGHP
jgi:flavin-dependent dehydrogenase